MDEWSLRQRILNRYKEFDCVDRSSSKLHNSNMCAQLDLKYNTDSRKKKFHSYSESEFTEVKLTQNYLAKRATAGDFNEAISISRKSNKKFTKLHGLKKCRQYSDFHKSKSPITHSMKHSSSLNILNNAYLNTEKVKSSIDLFESPSNKSSCQKQNCLLNIDSCEAKYCRMSCNEDNVSVSNKRRFEVTRIIANKSIILNTPVNESESNKVINSNQISQFSTENLNLSMGKYKNFLYATQSLNQSKNHQIAMYTTLCKYISLRDRETISENTQRIQDNVKLITDVSTKFKSVTEMFPVSHGSEHRNALGFSHQNNIPLQNYEIDADLNPELTRQQPSLYNKFYLSLNHTSLEGGNPAWAKKNQFKNLTPIPYGFGRRMMEKMGWKEGQPLGIVGTGVTLPLEFNVKLDRKGLGGNSLNKVRSSVVISNFESTNNCEINFQIQSKNPISTVMEICCKKKWQYPTFRELKSESNKFKFKIITPLGEFEPKSFSNNKKEAKRQAAILFLNAYEKR